MIPLLVVESAVLVVLCVLVSGLLRSHATILRRLHELDGGDRPAAPRTRSSLPGPTAGRPASLPAHDVNGIDVDQGAVAIRVAGVEHDTILAFLSSGCTSCGAFWTAVGDADLVLPEGTRLVVVTQGAEHEHIALVAALAAPHLTVVLSTEAWTDYAVPGSPYVVLVEGPTGRVVGEGTAHSFGQVLSMLGRAVDDNAHRSSLAAQRGKKAAADARREGDIDEALLSAGLTPGDPSLYRSLDDALPPMASGPG